MENIVLDSITIVVDSLAMVAALLAKGVSLYTYYKTYVFYTYQELDNMYMRILEIGIEHHPLETYQKLRIMRIISRIKTKYYTI
jgi:hypothetical protein